MPWSRKRRTVTRKLVLVSRLFALTFLSSGHRVPNMGLSGIETRLCTQSKSCYIFIWQLFLFKIWYKKILAGSTYSNGIKPFQKLFFYCYEDKWIQKLKRKDLKTAPKFGNITCFSDFWQPGGGFEKALHEIYSPEFQLKKRKHITFQSIVFRSQYRHFR